MQCDKRDLRPCPQAGREGRGGDSEKCEEEGRGREPADRETQELLTLEFLKPLSRNKETMHKTLNVTLQFLMYKSDKNVLQICKENLFGPGNAKQVQCDKASTMLSIPVIRESVLVSFAVSLCAHLCCLVGAVFAHM